MRITLVLSAVLLTATGVAEAQYGSYPASQQNPVQGAASALQQSSAAAAFDHVQSTAAVQRANATRLGKNNGPVALTAARASIAPQAAAPRAPQRVAMNNASAQVIGGGPVGPQPTPAPVVPGGPTPGWTRNLTIPVQGGTGIGSGGGGYGGGGLGYGGGGGYDGATGGAIDGGAGCAGGAGGYDGAGGGGAGPGGASNAYGGSLGASGFPWPGYAYGGPFYCYRHPCVRWFYWRSTGDMVQHVPYFPNSHGYYYYRPYNVIHVLQQQEMSARWGLDTRNPYDNRFFERIYDEQEQAQKAETSMRAMESGTVMVGLPTQQWSR